MNRWDQRGDHYYCAEGDWEYLIHQSRSVGMWRLAERRRGDVEWSTVTYCSTLETAMATQ